MTTSHNLSVIVNSCVKPPVNPDTGLSLTQYERSIDMRRDEHHPKSESNQQNLQVDSINKNGSGGIVRHHHDHVNESSEVFGLTDSMIRDLSSDIGNLSDDAFYKRLLELKNEHKKTLSLCETLYSQKIRGKDNHTATFHVDTNANGMNQAIEQRNKCSNDNRSEFLNNSYNDPRRSTAPVRDGIKDMSTPSVRRSRPQSAKPAVSVMRSLDFQHVQADHYSDEEEYWKPVSAVTTDVELSRDDSICSHPHQRHNDSKQSGLSQVDDMWEHFSVEEYAPPANRPRSSSLSRSAKRSNKNDDGSLDTRDWRHRITLVKPFNMSLRERTTVKEKSQTLREYEEKKEEEKRAMDKRCQRKFKAKPVPAHVYMPLYDEKMDEMESKRKFNQQNSKELLRSMEKPFNFMKREDERKKYRGASRKDVANAEIQQKIQTCFKARPFPAHIFDDTVLDRLHEEEEYRKIRVQMRAEELLKTSSLPPNMAAKGKEYTEGKSRRKMYAERAKRAGITCEHKFQPQINDDLPDFEEKHRQIQMDLSCKKRAKEATVCKPFNLRTERIASRRHKVYEDADKLKDWSFKKPSHSKSLRMVGMSSSMDSIPTKMTASAQLRTSANRNKMQQVLDEQLAELERERQQRLKEKKIKKYVAERVALNDHSKDLEQSLKLKLKQFKRSEKDRDAEYLQMLNEIEERIEKRPLLFERALQVNAKRVAERKYQDTLHRAGFDSEYIASQGRNATNADMDALSDEESYCLHHGDSARSSARSSYRTSTSPHSCSRRYSDDEEEEVSSHTSEDSDRD